MGEDLCAEQPPEVIATLRAAFAKYYLLLLRDQDITFEQQEGFCRWFGFEPSKRLPKVFTAFGREPELPSTEMYIANTDADDPSRGTLGLEGEVKFEGGNDILLPHADYCYEDVLQEAVCLYGEDVQSRAGKTIFVNQVKAAQQLDETTRRDLAALHVLNVFDIDNSDCGTMASVRWDEPEENYPEEAKAVHPLLLDHPRTGDQILFANQLMTNQIVERSRADSDALLHKIFARLEDPSLRYYHEWHPRDLIIWDNIALQHGRTATPRLVRRNLRRVQLQS